MTVPFKIAIPILLATPLVAWFSGTRKYDFMTPRDIPASELRPDFASPVDRDVAALLDERPINAAPPIAPKIVKIEFGDLQVSPGLAEYRDHAELGALPLFDLAQRLQNSGQVQRAVLAYERVLDSTAAGSSVQADAVNALINLKAVLPMWNPDPANAVSLQIHLDTARTAESLAGAIATLTELVVIGSGNQCQPSFHIRNSPSPTAPLPALPVALWMTIPGEDPDKPSLEVVTLTPQSDDELDSRLTHGLYRLLVRRIDSIGTLTTPPELSESDDPEGAIVNKISRLGWKQILETPFQSLQAGPPSEALSEETEKPLEGEANAEENEESTENAN